jgi:hypothetical protein
LPRYFVAALSRLLQSLQNFGQVAAFSVLPAAFVSFHSSAHFFWRSRAASWPALALFSFWQSSRMPSTIDGFQARTGTVGLNSTTRFAP